MAITYSRWTENELLEDIQRLGNLITEARQRTGNRSRCAVAYLTQVLRDRRDSLATIRVGKRNRVH